MIFAYNKEHVGDVLLVIVADDQGAENQVKRVGDVARVSLVEAPETVVAWNIFNASALLGDINDFQKPLKKTTPLKLWSALSNHVKNTQIQIIYLSHKQK